MIDAIVLRTVQYRDHDLIVELLTAEEGRTSAMARGAKKSRKRYGAALEIGNRVRIEFGRAGRGLRPIGTIDVLKPTKAALRDLDRFQQLCYALELGARMAPEGEPDRIGFSLLDGFLDSLEAWPATPLGLVTWELAYLAHHGYALQFWPCVRSGDAADMLSFSAGGAYARAAGTFADGLAANPEALQQLHLVLSGAEPTVGVEAHFAEIRRLLDYVWTRVTGRALRSARFLLLPAPIAANRLNETQPTESAMPTADGATTL
jgi:DNA repair protein RecO